MSQPHGGHRTFLPSGNPFRMIFPKGTYFSKPNVLLSSFEQMLAEDLKKLKTGDVSDIWSLSWFSQAVSFLAETHNNIKTLITDLELPVSDWDEKWIDPYLESSVKVLDICIALSSELSRLDQGQVLLQYVLHQTGLSSNGPSSEMIMRVRSTLSEWILLMDSRSPKLDDCCAALQDLAETLYSAKIRNSAKGKVLVQALYAVKVVTVFVCSVFTSALCGCSKPLVTVVVADKFLWAEAYNDLQAYVLKGMAVLLSSEKPMVPKELGDVEKCVKGLCALSDSICEEEEKLWENSSREIMTTESGNDWKERWRESVLELAEASDRLSLGLDHLSKQVGDFFQIVLRGRDALLGNIGALDEVPIQEADDADERL